MERWRVSRRRREWLKLGERFNGDAATGDAAPLTARASAIETDDGSLGWWLPADATTATASARSNASPVRASDCVPYDRVRVMDVDP